MSGGTRGSEPNSDVGTDAETTGGIFSHVAIKKSLFNTLFTFRIEQEPLLVSDLAAILTLVSEIHTKLTLIRPLSRRVVEYMATGNPRYVHTAGLTVESITTNSPLTVVLVVSEALGKALASLIDAVTQTRIRYDKAKLDLEQSRLAATQQHMQIRLQLQQQAETHEMDMRERLIAVETRLVELEALKVVQRDAELEIEVDKRRRLSEASLEVITQLYPQAEEEIRQVFVQAVMKDLLDLCSHNGIVVESVKPRKSA